jgi:tetratricopeptide (TPR) repeat protein
MLGLAYEGAGHYDLAIRSFEVAAEIEEHAMNIGALGNLFGLTGKRAKARHALARLRSVAKTKTVSPYFYALISAGLEETDEAVRCLEEAYVEGCEWLIHAGVEPDEIIGAVPRASRRLIGKVGLPFTKDGLILR